MPSGTYDFPSTAGSQKKIKLQSFRKKGQMVDQDNSVPSTPLLEAPPSPLFPFNQSTASDIGSGGTFHQPQQSRWNKAAIIGICLFFAVIVCVLVIVAVAIKSEESSVYPAAQDRKGDDTPTETSSNDVPHSQTGDSNNSGEDLSTGQPTTESATLKTTSFVEDTTDSEQVEDIIHANDSAFAHLFPNQLKSEMISHYVAELIAETDKNTFTNINKSVSTMLASLGHANVIVADAEKMPDHDVPSEEAGEPKSPGGKSIDGRSNSDTTPHFAGVICNRGERRCRDRKQCYLSSNHCDFKVDCKDFSDEDSCTCRERLDRSRLCDGYSDCLDSEDETGCAGCTQTEFFCEKEKIYGNSVCIGKSFVCDGVEDCVNGRDEEGCLLIIPLGRRDPATVQPADSDIDGLLTVKVGSEYKFLTVRDQKEEAHLATLAKTVCEKLDNLESTMYSVISIQNKPDNLAYIKSVSPSSRFEFEAVNETLSSYDVVVVECVLKTCPGYEHIHRTKRAHHEYLEGWSGDEIENAFSNGSLQWHIERAQPQARIVGGVEAEIGRWPATAAIYRNGVFICGSTVITPQWIITAGHCFYRYNKGDIHFRVRVGMQRKQSLSPWEQIRYVTEVYINPNYENVFLRHDVALGKLNTALHINKYVQTVCLPANKAMSPPPPEECWAAGWGLITEHGFQSEELKEVKLEVLSGCKRSYNNISYQICAGGKDGKDSCQGDSGGPLYCKAISGEEDEVYLGGVISHGKGCGRRGEPGVYVRLAVYLNWIHTVLTQVNKPDGAPSQECPGMVCGSGECVKNEFVCDDDVDCLDNGDVQHCFTVDGEGVQIVPESLETAEKDPATSDLDEYHKLDLVQTDQTNIKKVEIINRDLTLFERTPVNCTSTEFSCSPLSQCIPREKRCDDVLDCFDGSDEMNCSCADKLVHSHPHYVNDGYADCADRSDEQTPFCSSTQFRCPMTDTCLEKEQRCNNKVDCPNGEDEMECVLLVDVENLNNPTTFNYDKNQSGYLVFQHLGEWKPICLKKFSTELANKICSFIGFDGEDATFRMSSSFDTSEESTCSQFYVYIECGPPVCGLRANFRQAGFLPMKIPGDAPGNSPWTVSFFFDGQFVCSGTLVHPSFVITSVKCAFMCLRVNERRDIYLTILAGQFRITNFGFDPNAQIRRVASFTAVPKSKIALGYVDKPFKMTSHVSYLCPLSSSFVPKDTYCTISGHTKSEWAIEYALQIGGLCNYQGEELCECDKVYPYTCSYKKKTPAPYTNGWTGALACPAENGLFHAFGLYFSDKSEAPDRFISLTPNVAREGLTDMISSTLRNNPKSANDTCPYRCRLGNCLKMNKLCNGKWDCVDGSDETHCESKLKYPACEPVGDEMSTMCACPKDYGKCDNGLCIPMDKFCDGTNDCLDGSDELNGCKSCVNKLRFSRAKAICDGIVDCWDGGDEDYDLCGCPETSFQCSVISNSTDDHNNTQCRSLEQLCDKTKQCNSGRDEDVDMCISLSSKYSVKENAQFLPNQNQNGYLKVRLQGIWYTYCYPNWNDEMSWAICTSLGYSGVLVTMQHIAGGEVVDIGELISGSKTPAANSCRIIYIACE